MASAMMMYNERPAIVSRVTDRTKPLTLPITCDD
jgi:hypothetical protein